MKLDYQSSDTELKIYIVQPLGLVTKEAIWYLGAETDEGQRTFQISRVQSADVQERSVERRIGFDLRDAWRSITDTQESSSSSSRVGAKAVAERWTISLIRNMTPIRLREMGQDDKGRTHIELSAPSIHILAHGLAGFGPAIVVSEPPELVRTLGELGHQLVDRYGSHELQP